MAQHATILRQGHPRLLQCRLQLRGLQLHQQVAFRHGLVRREVNGRHDTRALGSNLHIHQRFGGARRCQLMGQPALLNYPRAHRNRCRIGPAGIGIAIALPDDGGNGNERDADDSNVFFHLDSCEDVRALD